MNKRQMVTRLEDLESRVGSLETRVGAIEEHFGRRLDDLGDYKNRTEAELADMCVELTTIVGTLESLISKAEADEEASRARRLLARARNNKTRAEKARRGSA